MKADQHILCTQLSETVRTVVDFPVRAWKAETVKCLMVAALFCNTAPQMCVLVDQTNLLVPKVVCGCFNLELGEVDPQTFGVQYKIPFKECQSLSST